MRLLELTLDRYRNISRAELNLGNANLHLIVGENGQGKTNLLSSIYWLSTLTPLRTRKIKELVQWGESACAVRGGVELRGLTHQLQVGYRSGTRFTLREGNTVNSRAYFGALTVVSFTPSDLDLVRGSPDSRRRFLDRAIFNEHSAHLDVVINYQRALDARNRLIKEGANDDLLRAYEETLADLGAKLMQRRAQYLHTISSVFVNTLYHMCNFTGSISYKPAISIADPLSTRQDVLRDQLAGYWAQHRSNDRQRGFTQRGPQMDDFVFRLNEHSARAYASQGQQRAFALALKIAQIDLLSERIGSRPILLLDDVSSEFDRRRSTMLFNYLDNFDGQVFLTTTHKEHIPAYKRAQLWRVEGGRISSED